MTTDELIARFERGIEETGAKFRSQGTMIAIGSVIVSGFAALRQIWFLVPVCLLFAAGIWFLMRAATRNSGPERAAPVLEALRRAPGRIKLIAHRETSDSHGMFRTQWIEILSDDGGRIWMRADDDWSQLIDALVERCPQADVKR